MSFMNPLATHYDRLRAVSQLRVEEDDAKDEAAYHEILQRFEVCASRVKEYQQSHGYQAQVVRDAIDDWVGVFLDNLETSRAQLVKGKQAVDSARAVMRSAATVFKENVSEELFTDAEKGLKDVTMAATGVATVVVPVGGVLAHVSADQYFKTLESQRSEQRESFCKTVLKDLNDQVGAANKQMQDVLKDRPGKKKHTREFDRSGPGDSGSDPAWGSDPGLGDGGIGGPGVGGIGGGSGDLPGLGSGGLDSPGLGLGGKDPSAMAGIDAPGSDWMSEGFQKPGLPQDAPDRVGVDDLDGVGLVDRPINQTVTPNGLVDGYTPPSATNLSDPRWDPSYKMPSSVGEVSKLASSGAFGAVGAGAAGALKNGLSARSLLAGGASGMPGSASGLGALGSGKTGAAGLPGGASGLGAGKAGGLGVADGKGVGAGTGAAGQGMMGAGGAGGAAGKGDDKKRKKKRSISGVFADADEQSGPVWDPAHGPGSVNDGVEFELDLDEWGL